MKIVIETPEEAYTMREALRFYDYNTKGWKHYAILHEKIEAIRCHRFLENSSLVDAKREVEDFMKYWESVK